MPMPAAITRGRREAPPAETLAELAAVQPEKREAFEAGAQMWVSWNNGYTASSTTGSTLILGDQAWGAWNVVYSGTAGNGYAFSSTTGSTIGGTVTWSTWNSAYQETEDERLEREERQRQMAAERQARWDAEEKARLEANARALGLLRSLLSDEQWASYQEKGCFEVRGSSGRRWRIRDRGQSGNVDLMPEIGEERAATYCAHPPGGLPTADAHAAQMLALVTDDEAFLRTANLHWRRAA